MNEIDEVWQEFWIDYVFEGKEPTLDQIKAELFDYHNFMSEAAKVYDAVTHGRISKPNTKAEAVIGVYEDCLNESIRDAVDDMVESYFGETGL